MEKREVAVWDDLGRKERKKRGRREMGLESRVRVLDWRGDGKIALNPEKLWKNSGKVLELKHNQKKICSSMNAINQV